MSLTPAVSPAMVAVWDGLAVGAPTPDRARQHEDYLDYVVQQVKPLVQEDRGILKKQGIDFLIFRAK